MRSRHRSFCLATILLLTTTAAAMAQVPPNEKIIEMTMQLFEAEALDLQKGVKWRPYGPEAEQMNVSDDGYCYTKFDTALLLDRSRVSDGFDARLVLLFNTKRFEGNTPVSCDTCSPVLSIASYDLEGDDLQFVGFQKWVNAGGEWGAPPMREVMQLGDNEYGLLLQESWIHGDTANNQYKIIYLTGPTTDFPLIFDEVAYQTYPYSCTSGCVGPDCQNYHQITRGLGWSRRSDVTPKQFYNLRVEVTRTTCDGEEKVVETYGGFEGGWEKVAE